MKMKKNRKITEKFNLLLFGVLLIVICVVSLYSYSTSRNIKFLDFFNSIFKINSKNYMEILNTENLSKIEGDSTASSVFKAFRGYIVKVDRFGVALLSQNGSEKIKFQNSFNNPIIKVAGEYLIVGDIGGKEIIVLKGNQKMWDKKIEDNIYSLDINISGFSTIVHTKNGYKSALTVYNSQGMLLFSNAKAEKRIISASISPNSRYVAVQTIDTKEVSIKSAIEFMDLTGKALGQEYNYENIILSSMRFTDDDSLFVFADSKYFSFDKNQTIKWDKTIQGNILTVGITQNGKKPVIVMRNNDSGNAKSYVYTISNNGELNKIFTVDYKVNNIYTYDDIIAINLGMETILIDSGGDFVGRYVATKDINGISFFDNKTLLVSNKIGANVIEVK